ncbi:MAG: cupin domain-containing protein [Sphingomonadaceae bacterium]|nr:cupin domain-containing protein [Sphingomonadaceae bacterium]
MALSMIALLLAQAASDLPVRVPLGEVPLPAPKSVERVIVMRVNFAPGQAMPAHVHPAPVVCLVETGSFDVRIGDAPARTVHVGEVTLEPANVPVGWFRNLSATSPASLVCTFLAGHDDHEISRMLPGR